MQRTVRGVVVGAVVAGIVLAAGSVAEAKPKKQSVSKYAKTVCTTYSKLSADFTNYTNGIDSLDMTDTAGFASQAVTQTNAFLAEVKADEKTLQNVYPDISNGKKVGALIATRATELDNVISPALSQLQSGTGPAGPAVFGAALQTVNAKVSDPFSKVTDQGLINGFQKEKSCKDVVHVIGR
jgi:outer membrane murein-binding lipoprotein Lpp